ncbi:XRE family transcriptional regulator [Larkinella arboricola]
MKIGEKITKLRTQSHLSMNALARMLGVSPPTLKRIEQELSQADSSVLSQLQTLTGFPVEKWINDKTPLPNEVKVIPPTTIRTVINTNSKDYEAEQAAWRHFLSKLISELAEGNQVHFARKIGLENAFLNKMLSGNLKITKATMYRVGQYTGRYDWLPAEQRPGVGNSGPVHEGQALKRYLDEKNTKQVDLARLLNKNKATITTYIQSEKLQDRTWNAITAVLGAGYEEIVGAPEIGAPESEPRIVGPSVKPYYAPIEAPDQYTSVMLIPVRDRAGFQYSSYIELEGERINVLTDYLERLNRITDPAKREEEKVRYVVIEIDGDSMEPRLEAGFKVLAYQLDSSAWAYQASGIYAVEFGDQLVVKRIKDNTLLESGILTLHSDNPEGGRLSVPLSEIRNIWKVERIIDGRL